jgi:hypothetical protein
VEDVIDTLRIRKNYRGNRAFYIIISDKEIICSVPPDGDQYLNAVLTSLTRCVSVMLQDGIPLERVKKQLHHSSIIKGDIPSLLLEAINEYQDYQNTGKTHRN